MASTNPKDVAVSVPEESSSADSTTAPPASSAMVPFSKLFRFYHPEDMTLLLVGAFFCAIGGASFPCINIAFGELLDPRRRSTTSRRRRAARCCS